MTGNYDAYMAIMALRLKKWCFRADVKFELIKFLKNREFAFIVPKWMRRLYKDRATDVSNRNWRVHSVQHFDAVMNSLIFNSKIPRVVNLYYSLATYKNGVPMQTLSLKDRDNADWKENGWKEMIGYDMLIDVDIKSHRHVLMAHESAKVIKKLFDDYNIVYELRFSGMGFHFIVPASALPKKSFDPKNSDSIYAFVGRFLKALNKNITEIMDTIVIDSRRLCKLPYSVVFYIKKNYICAPILSDEEFYSFNLEKYEYNPYAQIRGRGTFLFNAMYIDTDNASELLKKMEMGKWLKV